jgi:hypothetical protein
MEDAACSKDIALSLLFSFLIYSYFDFILMVGVLVVVASSQFPVTCNLGMYLEDPDIV